MTINQTPANHPRSCTHCHGTGWEHPNRCTHHWTDDELHDDNVCTFERGIQIAWQAYVEECQRQGREPNQGRFDRWIG